MPVTQDNCSTISHNHFSATNNSMSLSSPFSFSLPSRGMENKATGAIHLNNASAFLIENGHYDTAIASLQRALELLELHIMEENTTSTNDRTPRTYCMCNECTLEGCIRYSEQQHKINRFRSQSDTRITNDIGNHCCHSQARTESSNKRRRITYHQCEGGETIENNESDYIYQRPILIPNTHEMGSTRFFVILFNIALAHHLKVLRIASTKNKGEIEQRVIDTDSNVRESIRKALLIYELMFEYWSRLERVSKSTDDEDAKPTTSSNSSFRFVMIMYNNMSQMYRLANDRVRQTQCLQQLLSIIMISVESKKRSSGFASSRGATESTVHTTGSSDSSNINANGEDESNAAFRESLDGFLKNTATLMMSQTTCAEAA